MTFKVVIPGGNFPEEEFLKEAGAETVRAGSPGRPEEEVIASYRDADAIIISGEKITRKVVDSMEKCKIISRMGIGYDSIDVTAATAKGIPVAVVPDASTVEVSDHVMAMILALAKKLIPLNQAVRKGLWGKPEMFQIAIPGFRIAGKTLGLIGLGRIGKAVARKAQAFGMKVIAYDPFVFHDDVKELGIELVGMDRLLPESDYISVHSPLTGETKHLINAEAFKRMKKTAYLINAARGGVVDEQALYIALKEKTIAGAGIDVTDPEPPKPDNPLFQLDNIIITPHFAWYSEESAAELRQRATESVIAIIKGEWPRTIVNPEVKK
jgi:D-3-phosphoglycerate dehydrogenase